MNIQKLYRGCDFITKGDAEDEDIFAKGLCLPSDIKMTEEEQEKVIEIIKECFE